MIRSLYRKTLTLIYFINFGKTVPIDYCLQPLDQSDCGLKPTPVFSYYKPGSRCEIEFWRGCPTLNKFDNEFICSHHCIGKLWGRTDENNVDFKMMASVIENADGDKCKLPMNEDDCGVKEQLKYTFISNMTCVKVAWKGCESPNLFDDESTCFNTCIQQSSTDDLMIQLEELPMDDVKAINNILDNVMDERAEKTPEFMPQHQMLMLKKENTVKGTTEAETTVKTGTVSEAVETTKGVQETKIVTDGKETNTEVIETTTEVNVTRTEVIEVTTEVKGTTVEVTETTVTAEVTTPETIVSTKGPFTHPPVLTNPATLTDSVTTEMGDPEEVVLTI